MTEYDELLKRLETWSLIDPYSGKHFWPEKDAKEAAASIRALRKERDDLQAQIDALKPRPIEDAPQDDTELVVMWDDREQVWDAATEKWVLDPDAKPNWKAAFSQFTDLGYRRGFRHRNGANKATHFIPVSAITALAALEQKP